MVVTRAISSSFPSPSRPGTVYSTTRALEGVKAAVSDQQPARFQPGMQPPGHRLLAAAPARDRADLRVHHGVGGALADGDHPHLRERPPGQLAGYRYRHLREQFPERLMPESLAGLGNAAGRWHAPRMVPAAPRGECPGPAWPRPPHSHHRRTAPSPSRSRPSRAAAASRPTAGPACPPPRPYLSIEHARPSIDQIKDATLYEVPGGHAPWLVDAQRAAELITTRSPPAALGQSRRVWSGRRPG
jgi:hypothetical protein